MPANLPPQYIKLEEEFRRERDNHRRLELLQRMLAEIPKHKGTDHLQGELKSKISKLKSQLETAKKTGAIRHAASDHVPKEGAGQLVLFGPPNGGKSSIVGAVTNAHVEITGWPFATRKSVPGMATWENVRLQLVDTPSIAPEFTDPAIFNIIRACDVAVLVLSLGDDDLLDRCQHVVERVHEGKVRLLGLAEPDPRWPTALEKRTIVVGTGWDLDGADIRLTLLRAAAGEDVPVLPVSISRQEGLESFLRTGFGMLDLMRVYTKSPGHEPDLDDPILLPSGGNVGDAARLIHKEIAERLQYARIWSKGKAHLDGPRVPADHQLTDGDILEFHV